MADARETEAAVQRIAALIWPNEPHILVRTEAAGPDDGPTARMTVMSTVQNPRSLSGVAARPFYDP